MLGRELTAIHVEGDFRENLVEDFIWETVSIVGFFQSERAFVDG